MWKECSINWHIVGQMDRALKIFPSGTLGHRRLAILDIEGGNQPMGIDKTWITFNGEIYNYRELAREHLGEQTLRTHSDTEVILHLYRKFGTRCVELLDGMFAFAILDGNELFMARNPLGIKPIYYGEHDGALYFASEIKALAEVTNTIHEFPAGYWLHSHKGWRPYFEMNSIEQHAANEIDTLEQIMLVLKEAVSERLLADVPVGISLSGGTRQ